MLIQLFGSQVASFKYRYKTRDGHYEDHAPAMNTDARTVRFSFDVTKGILVADKDFVEVNSILTRSDVSRNDERDMFGFRFEWPH